MLVRACVFLPDNPVRTPSKKFLLLSDASFLTQTQLALHVEDAYSWSDPCRLSKRQDSGLGRNELIRAFSKSSLAGPSLRPHWLAL